jgi:serine protease AprX
MDIIRIPNGICLLMTILVLSSLSSNATTFDGDERPIDIDLEYSFDKDRNKIDDEIQDPKDFPLWTFIHIADGFTPQQVLEELKGLNVSNVGIYKFVPVISYQFVNMEELRSASRLSSIEIIEKDTEVWMAIDISARAMKVEASSEYSPETARDLGYYGEGMTVAVLDLGIDNDHPTLKGTFVAGADFSKPESPLYPRDGSFDPDDHNGHGTAVASVLAGRGQDGKHVGIAPKAGIIDLKMSDLNPAYQRNMAEAMEWCIAHRDTQWDDVHRGIDVISMSALTDTSPDSTLGQLQKRIAQEGIPFVQAAGNDGVKQGEGVASYWWSDDVIIVGGLDDKRTVSRSDDTYWDEATYGPRDSDGDDDPYDELKPDVVATATNLTLAGHSTSPAQKPSGWYVYEGTSYATPHISGIVALMIEANPDIAELEGRNVTETIRKILHRTAEARGEPYDPDLSEKYSPRYGFGIVDAYGAVMAALAFHIENQNPQIMSLDIRPSTATTGQVCEVKAMANDPDDDPIRYNLEIEEGDLSGEAPLWTWKAPDRPGTYSFVLEVTDDYGGSDMATTEVVVVGDGGEEEAQVSSSTILSSALVIIIVLIVVTLAIIYRKRAV